jgi:lysophospholipase L1-like esterase
MFVNINTRLVQLADENDKFQLALTEGLSYAADKIHLDIEGYRALGERMFDKYMNILGKKNK